MLSLLEKMSICKTSPYNIMYIFVKNFSITDSPDSAILVVKIKLCIATD